MWKDTNDRIMEILDNVETKRNEQFPISCPICRETGGHVYFHRFEINDDKGGVWVWCSNCHYFVHAMVKVPSWWKNLEYMSLKDLSYYPSCLDENKNSVDKWINELSISRKQQR